MYDFSRPVRNFLLEHEARAAIVALIGGFVLASLLLIWLNLTLDAFAMPKLTDLDLSGIEEAVNDAPAELERDAKGLLLYGEYGAMSFGDYSWRTWLPFLSDPEMTLTQFCDDVISELQRHGGEIDDPNEVMSVAEKPLTMIRNTRFYQFRRYVNGPIQFVTFWAFFWALGLSLMRLALGVWDSYAVRRVQECSWPPEECEEGLSHEELQQIRDKIASLKANLKKDYYPTDYVSAAERTCETYLASSLPELASGILRMEVESLRDAFNGRASMVRYLTGAIPAIGFVGTVIGIGQALGRADQIIAEQGSQIAQRGNVQAVTAALGTAFDTTLVALVASLILLLVRHFVEDRDEKLLRAFDAMGRDSISRMPEPDFVGEVKRFADKYSKDVVRSALAQLGKDFMIAAKKVFEP